MQRLQILAALSMGLLSGCTVMDQTLPVLGTVENGSYTQANDVFKCPLPGQEQGFVGDVEILDAGKLVETRQIVVPVDERKPWESALREETVYPARIVPTSTIRFTDRADVKRHLEILFRPLPPDADHDTVFASGYGGGNYGLLRESRGAHDGLEYGMAVLQLPYFVKGPGYMAVDLWASYLTGDEPGPDIDVVLNLMVGDTHYFVRLRTSALEFLAADINPKDLMAVYAALKDDPETLTRLEDRLFSWVRACRFAPLN